MTWLTASPLRAHLDTLAAEGELLRCHLVLDSGAAVALDAIGGVATATEWGAETVTALDRRHPAQFPQFATYQRLNRENDNNNNDDDDDDDDNNNNPTSPTRQQQNQSQQPIRVVFMITGFLWDVKEGIAAFVKELADAYAKQQQQDKTWFNVHVVSGISGPNHAVHEHEPRALDAHLFSMQMQEQCRPLGTQFRVSFVPMTLAVAPGTAALPPRDLGRAAGVNRHDVHQSSTRGRLHLLTLAPRRLGATFPLTIGRLAARAAKELQVLDRLAGDDGDAKNRKRRLLSLGHISDMEAQTMLDGEQKTDIKLLARSLGDELNARGLDVKASAFALGYTAQLTGNALVAHLRSDSAVPLAPATAEAASSINAALLIIDRTVDAMGACSHCPDNLLARIMATFPTHSTSTQSAARNNRDIVMTLPTGRLTPAEQVTRRLGGLLPLTDAAALGVPLRVETCSALGLTTVDLATTNCDTLLRHVHGHVWHIASEVIARHNMWTRGTPPTTLQPANATADAESQAKRTLLPTSTEKQLMELLSWLVRTEVDDEDRDRMPCSEDEGGERKEHNTSSLTSSRIQTVAMCCGVLSDLRFAAMVALAMERTGAGVTPTPTSTSTPTQWQSRCEWKSVDRFEHVVDKLSQHSHWLHLIQLADFARDECKRWQTASSDKEREQRQLHGLGLVLQELLRTYSQLGIEAHKAESEAGHSLGDANQGVVPSSLQVLEAALTDMLASCSSDTLVHWGLLSSNSSVPSPSWSRSAVKEVLARVHEVANMRRNLRPQDEVSDGIARGVGGQTTSGTMGRFGSAVSSDGQEGLQSGAVVPEGSLMDPVTTTTPGRGMASSVLSRVLVAGLEHGSRVREVQQVGASALQQVANVGINLLRTGLGAFGFGSNSSAQGQTASSSGAGAGPSDAWAQADVLVVFVIGGVCASDIAETAAVLERVQRRRGGRSPQIVLGGTSLASGRDVLREVFADAQVDLGRK